MENNTINILDKISISPYAKIKVQWSDRPENYSKEAKNKIKNYFANKYNVNKNNITVIYQPVKVNDNGDLIDITGAGIDNIMDATYQRGLMKEWVARENKNVSFDRLLKLDDKVNSELNIDFTEVQHKSWSMKWLMIDNFLSFGENNFLQFNKLKGLTVVNSIPSNQGGKCVRSNTIIKINYNSDEIIGKLGFLPDELKTVEEITIGFLHDIYQKYGDLNFKVETPYGYKNIEWCGITEENADIYRCELEDGKYVEGADYHRLKKEDGEFVVLKNAEVGTPIQTIDGISKIKTIELMDFKDTLYDIQVAEVHQYYSNGIVSHNTTLTIDAMKFLLHGNTTKTDTNSQIFNTYSGKNELVVRGMIDIEGDEIIIERKMKRNAKKDGGWTVINKVNYYRILPDGEEEELNEEDAKRTTVKLKATVGDEKDFEMLVLATEKNLDDLVGLTTTESGKVLSRLIGLEIIEMKEAVVRKMFNEFDKKKKANEYDVISLSNDIESHKEAIILNEGLKNDLLDSLNTAKMQLITLNNEKDKLFNNKEKIDVTITTLNPSKLESDIKILTEKGVGLKEKVSLITARIIEIGEVLFDEDKHHQLTVAVNKHTTEIAVKNAEITRLTKSIDDLVAGGICQSCNRKLDDVDNTEHIEKHNQMIILLNKEIFDLESLVSKYNSEIQIIDGSKKLMDEKNKLELDKDRLEVEMGGLRNDVVSKNNDLKKYKLNLNAIELNKKIDSDIELIKTNISVAEHTKETKLVYLQKVENEINNNNESINTKTKLIETIKKEDEIEKIFKVYIEMMGKKGISKLVLRSVLPIINSELQRLLDDVTDFDVEIFIDDKNDVQFLINKSDIVKPLKSGSGFEKTAASLALRGVLGKLSSLPMPNFITFDEVLGKVSQENIEKLKPLFDKIKDMYEIVFLITHNDLVKDWSTNIVTVVKENNISTVKLL